MANPDTQSEHGDCCETDDVASPETGKSDEVSFEAFHHAMHMLMASSCCGGGAGGATMAARRAQRLSPFEKLGFDAWRDSVKSRTPRLPTISGTYLLPDVTVVGPDGAQQSHRDVIVSGETIQSIVPHGAVHIEDVVEAARGRYVSAAFIDMHVHMPPHNVLRLTPLFMLQTLRHGITICRDAGDTDGTATPAALEQVYSGRLPGPDIHYAYSFINRPPARWANSVVYDDAAQAPAIVERLKRLGASWVKSYENLDVPRIAALKAAAAEAGLDVMGHVPTTLGLEEALVPDAQHNFGVPDPQSLRRDHVWSRMVDWQDVDQSRIDVIRRGAEAHDLAFTPTLETTRNALHYADTMSGEARSITGLLPSFYGDIVWDPDHGLPAYRGLTPDEFDRARDARERKHALVGQLYEDGADLRVGTDTQQPYVAPGRSFHQEVEEFEACGIPRSETVRLSTEHAAAQLGLDDAGHVASGQRAELLVSDRSPHAADWSPDTSLVAVAARGKLAMTADLDREIASELGRFESVFAGYTSRWLAKFAMKKAASRFVA